MRRPQETATAAAETMAAVVGLIERELAKRLEGYGKIVLLEVEDLCVMATSVGVDDTLRMLSRAIRSVLEENEVDTAERLEFWQYLGQYLGVSGSLDG